MKVFDAFFFSTKRWFFFCIWDKLFLHKIIFKEFSKVGRERNEIKM